MITFLEGVLIEKAPARIVMNVGGVGYEVLIPICSYDRLPAENHSCRVLTYDYVREDQHTLYGFMTEAERKVFVMLLSVSGIGPKLALCTLSGLSLRELTAAIAGGDVKRLSSISGVGKKIAERMVIDLRDKMASAVVLDAVSRAGESEISDPAARDAVLALISLGYKLAEAQKMVLAVMPPAGTPATVEDLVRKSLTR